MKFPTLILGVLALASTGIAQAEVVASDEDGFVTRDSAVVEATPLQVWLALISPGKWWNDGHTWSGDATNMTLMPQAGGCFCERIPEDTSVDRPTLEGSVEHMRVIQATPERALRLRGALGPLQSEPVTGVLTIALSEVNGGTRIVWEYIVGGYMRFEMPVIAPAVDGVMSQQLAGLADYLGGRIDAPAEEPTAEPAGDVPTEEAPPADGEGEEGAADDMPEERQLTLEEEIDALADDPE